MKISENDVDSILSFLWYTHTQKDGNIRERFLLSICFTVDKLSKGLFTRTKKNKGKREGENILWSQVLSHSLPIACRFYVLNRIRRNVNSALWTVGKRRLLGYRDDRLGVAVVNTTRRWRWRWLIVEQMTVAAGTKRNVGVNDVKKRNVQSGRRYYTAHTHCA